MSLQILQKPPKSITEETNSPVSLFENDPGAPKMETPQRFDTVWKSCPAPEKLEGEIFAGTQRQVRNIRVCCDHAGITVYGVSSSYYLKQLVTQIVQTFAPSIPLMNQVLVHAK